MAVTVTNTTLTAYNTDSAVTFNAATVDTADGTEVFTITPTGSNARTALFIKNVTGILAWSVAAGGAWAGQNGSAKTGTTAANTTDVIILETGKYQSSSGTIVITFTPASGTKLLTNHALSVYFVELP